MSLRLAIPRPVGLHQSPPPLCQPRISLTEIRYFEKEKSWNGRCANNGLSQLRGSPQLPVLIFVLTLASDPMKRDGSRRQSPQRDQLIGTNPRNSSHALSV